jgi:hypothetical protein
MEQLSKPLPRGRIGGLARHGCTSRFHAAEAACDCLGPRRVCAIASGEEPRFSCPIRGARAVTHQTWEGATHYQCD